MHLSFVCAYTPGGKANFKAGVQQKMSLTFILSKRSQKQICNNRPIRGPYHYAEFHLLVMIRQFTVKL